MTLAEKIKHIRTSAEVTQAQFAEYLGISRSYLGNLERGENINPDANVLSNLMSLEHLPPSFIRLIVELAQIGRECILPTPSVLRRIKEWLRKLF